MTYDQFKTKVIGKAFDMDNKFGAQCWDGYVKYCIENGIPFDHCTVSGYVKDIYNNRDSNNLLKYFNAIYTMQAGVFFQGNTVLDTVQPCGNFRP